MFDSARIKLTLWYLLIIMCVSVSFSVGIYHVLTGELDRLERVQIQRLERRDQLEQQLPPEIRQLLPPAPPNEISEIEGSKSRIKLILTLINLAILGISAGAGYFLAGRTLQPIKEMVDEQNRFITDASHELRTPLTSLKTSIEVNLRDKKMTLTGAKEILKSNLEEVNSLQDLSDSLLILAKTQKGNISRNDVLSVQELINASLAKVEVLANEKNIKILTSLKNVQLKGNRQELIRLVVILLDNAIKYSPNSSIVRVEAELVSNNIRINIKDEGVGISDKDLPNIFDRFYRADKSRSQNGGYGLGLSIAQKVVQDHHGSITVKSKLGKGTHFSVLLPIRNG